MATEGPSRDFVPDELPAWASDRTALLDPGYPQEFSPTLALGDIAMRFLHAVPGGSQALAKLVRDHDAAMVASGATEGDGQIAFPFFDVVGQQVYEQR